MKATTPTTKILLTFFLFAAISISANAQSKLNFSGRWKLNKEKCDFGTLSPNSAPVDMKVIQDKKVLSVERKQVYGSGETTVYTEKMNLDGKSSETVIKEGLKKITTVKWADDGLSLFDESVYSNGQKAKGKWSLSEDQKTLTLNRESTNGDSTDKVSYVFDKQ